MTTPEKKAIQVLERGDFDSDAVLTGLANSYPTIFLMLVKTYPKVSVPVGESFKLNNAQVNQVANLLFRAEHIGAIKYVKGITGLGLKEAKGLVDAVRDKYLKMDNHHTASVIDLLKQGRYSKAVLVASNGANCSSDDAIQLVDRIKYFM